MATKPVGLEIEGRSERKSGDEILLGTEPTGYTTGIQKAEATEDTTRNAREETPKKIDGNQNTQKTTASKSIKKYIYPNRNNK